jgi:hypothetical protein
VLATIFWDGGAVGDNNWAAADNWVGDELPGPSDDAGLNGKLSWAVSWLEYVAVATTSGRWWPRAVM